MCEPPETVTVRMDQGLRTKPDRTLGVLAYAVWAETRRRERFAHAEQDRTPARYGLGGPSLEPNA
ncbi:hypothetical protein [Rhizohabitans arisaemae]|uniref:hypothetical protein n=1 Tax=Rhizohabitans arisaemae TaxID=2720610 RepID=UPI0024B11720|nr:hypothetical protein [Rhizohabitans arisaemae]